MGGSFGASDGSWGAWGVLFVGFLFQVVLVEYGVMRGFQGLPGP